MAWESSPTTISSAVSVTTTTFANESTHVTLADDQVAQVQVSADYPVTPTDDLEVGVFTTPNAGTTEDNEPYMSFRMPSGGNDPSIRTFVIGNVKEFFLMYRRTGSTDTITVTATATKNRS